MRPIEWIVVHTSGTADKQGRPIDATAAEMRRYHIEHNGWLDIGYHFVIRMDGSIEPGRSLDAVGAHVGGFNQKSVGICCSGDGDFAPFTMQQRRTLATLCATLCRERLVPTKNVIGHREADEHGAPAVLKTCPGKLVDMDQIRADVLVALNAATSPPATTPPSLEARVADLERKLAALESPAHG